MRGRPSEYKDRRNTSVSVEAEILSLAREIGINISTWASVGIRMGIDVGLIQKEDLTSDQVERYQTLIGKEIRQQNAEYIKQNLINKKITEKLEEIKAREAESKDLIKVWDKGIQEYVLIKRSEFNPDFHSIGGEE